MKPFSISPWKTAYSYSHEYIRDIKDAQGELIAQVCDLEKESSESVSNARMMAAAPEMLDMLYRLLPFIEDIESDTAYKPGIVRQLRLEMLAVINRATGE
jgi:hypothetical protein